MPPVMVIIDEYDNFTNQLLTARNDELYREVTTKDSFLRTFFKTIKAGVGEGTVNRVFITGVLPVTMDDLTSGFNIGEVVTLESPLLNMMGFTQTEVDGYVDSIFSEHGWDKELRAKVGEDLRSHYNGYRLLPDATETLYNSTIMNYYLKKLVLNDGAIPTETIDENLRVDVNWIRRLTGSETKSRELLEKLMFEGTMPVDISMLRSKFNMEQFTEEEFYPLSLYFLGMVTFRDRYSLGFPNLTVKTIFTGYFNEVERIDVSLRYAEIFRQFGHDHDLEKLFSGYCDKYLGQIPAQAFDKVNENFIRTTFYELCTRYLSPDFMFAIEVNRPSGRTDWEAMGRDGTQFEGKHLLVEFKHYTNDEGKKKNALSWDKPREEEVNQVISYAKDVNDIFPNLRIERHICYTVGNSGFRWFKLGDMEQ